MKRVWNSTPSTVSFINNQQVTVFGTVTPIDWDPKGRAVKFSIYTHDEEDIIIENSTHNHKLRLLLNRTVEATGKVYENDEGEKCMWLTKIRGIRGPSSPAVATKRTNNSWYEEFSINVPNEMALFKDNGYFDSFMEAC